VHLRLGEVQRRHRHGRTHPQVIVGGILRENPFYVPPDEFLRDLRDRGSAAH
jgi:hypothetical protein